MSEIKQPITSDFSSLPAGSAFLGGDMLPNFFDYMPNGVAYCKMLYAEDGKPQDFVYLYTNLAFHLHTGLGDVIGKAISEVLIGVCESNPEIIEIYGAVAAGGEYKNFEIFVDGLQKWLSIQAFSPQPEHFVAIFTVINERKYTEQALVKSELRYKGLLEDQTEIICRFKADGTILYVNEPYCRLFGKSQKHLLGTTWHPVAWHEDVALINDKLSKLSPENSVVTIENRIINADGEIRWAQFVNRAFFDEQGVLLEIQAVGRDITEQKQAEIVNLELYQRLTDIASRVPGMIYQYQLRPDGSSCFPYASEAIRDIYRVTPEQVREDAAAVYAILHPNDYAGIVTSIQQSANNLEPWQHEYRVRFADGTVRWLFGNAIPKKLEDESVLWHGFITDCTERKAIEQQLRNLSIAIEQSSISVVITDLDANVEYVNNSFTRITGYSKDEVIGKNPHILSSGLTPPETYLAMWANLKQGLVWHGELFNKRKNGEIYCEELHISPVCSDNGVITHYVAAKLDISERKLIEQALQSESIKNQIFLRNASDGVVIMDYDGKIIEVSDSFCTMLGYSRDEMIGMHVSEWDAHFDNTELMQMVKQKIEKKIRTQFETRHRRKDGSYYDAEISVFPIELNGKTFLFNSTRDITERKQLEQQLITSTQEIQDLYNNAPCGYHSIDKNGIVLNINTTELQWLGCTREEVIGKNIAQFFTPASQAFFKEKTLPKFMKEGRVENAEYELIGRNGVIRQISVSATAITDDEGHFLRSRSVLYDITEFKKTQKSLHKLTIEQQAMLNNDLVGIVKASDRRIVWINNAMERMFGYSMEEMRGQLTRIFYLNDAAYQSLAEACYPVLKAHGIYRTQIEMLRKDGEKIWIDLSGVELPDNDNDSVWMLLDITALKEYQQKLEDIAYHDTLTGLPNRLLVTDRLTQALAHTERTNQPLAICYIDLDGFKPINDKFGHLAGDKVLIEIARRMKAAIRANDTVGHFGGDEFVLLLTSVKNPEDYQIVLQRLLLSINEPIVLNDAWTVNVGASIGVTLYPLDNNDPDILLRHADQAMYDAKQSGRNCVRLFNLN